MKNKRIIIEGKETYYLIYENGEVYSEYASKFLKPRLVRGYLGVSLRFQGKTYSRYIHRLVAEHFLTIIEDCEVNHIDGNKLNNNLSNLEWISHTDNIKHAYNLGLTKASVEQIKRPVLKIDKDTGEIIKEYDTILSAALELGNRNKMPNIVRACQGKQKTSYGFKWEYKDGRKDMKWNEL